MRKLVLGCVWAVSAATAQANDGGVEFSGSGFLTVAAGKVLGGDGAQDFNGYRAPMFVSDYGQGGIYQRGGWTLKPDSKLGLQGTAAFNPHFSVTGQAVARGARDGQFNLEWAYLNYVIDDRLTFQLGRKRLPLFYYSETQDVGLAYPWVHLPPGQYGWEIVNYNGANLLYRDQWGGWSSSMNFFAGGETRRDNPYQKIYNGKDTRTDSRWSNIRGADMTLARDWVEVRAAYIQSDIQNRFEDPTIPPPYGYSPKAAQKIYALSFSVDQRNWVVRNEYLYMDRKPMGEEDYSFLLGVGYRIGPYLPMLTYNRYRMRLSPHAADPTVIDPASIDPLAAERWSTLAFSLRYDLTPTSAVKAQLERWRDDSGSAFNANASGNSVPFGNARLLSVSYDMVF
ncbi:MAG: hypothetical protein EKK46_06005 [Rhodocyclaceae bacterium]|nr:MAG: hypothetical protein EKK46_06005 [Rhodocyclaceae bacterium]